MLDLGATNEKFNIICLSNQLWDFPNWTNKRHVMSRMAKLGNTVLFVDPPLNIGNVFLSQIKRGLWDISRFFLQYKKDAVGAVIYSPLNTIPHNKITSKWHIGRINRLARKFFQPNQRTILWVYHVQLAELKSYLDELTYDILVYDCVDNYSAFPEQRSFHRTVTSNNETVEVEKHLATRASIVFASAPGLVERLKKCNQNTYFTPNVGDYEEFHNAKQFKDQLPHDLKDIPRPRIGYVGAIDTYKFNADLIKKAALDHPNYSFVLIGSLALKDKEGTLSDFGLDGISNIYYLGVRPYKQKKYYYAGFDVDLIPYVLNDYTIGGCFPVKFHDSLAAGLPVIVTDLPAYYPFRDVCYISKSYNEFSENIKRALSEDSPDLIKRRQLVAKDNNWDGKVQQMLGYIKQSL